MRARARAAAALLTAFLLAACGGSGGGGGGETPPPSAGPAPGGQNPCLTAAAQADFAVPALPPAGEETRRKADVIDGDPRWRVLDALWTNRQRGLRPRVQERLSTVPRPDALDVGDIAVLQDDGTLIAPANPYDLRSLGLRFTRNAAGGYDALRIDGAFRQALGSAQPLADDDSRRIDVPFAFPFFGTSRTVAFVNSDGNITFEEEDRASTERNVARFLTGPPRVALFFADLDPSTGGRVFAHAAADQYTVTWCGVRGYDSSRTTTAQATLLPDGSIEMKFGETILLPDAIVGVSPGRTGAFTPVNLSDAGPTPGGAGAVGERFAEQTQLDTVAVVSEFYRSHPDEYDQLVIWTDAPLIRDAFAYQTTVANEIRGLGIPIYDASREFGSAGRLRSYAMMDWIDRYPQNPAQKFLGENTTLSVLAHEVAHRWLAFVEFRDRTGQRSEALLGRALAHWSFFFDSDGSVMEGNDIEDLGGGSFRTAAAVERYSRLDQYAMGLIPESAVPPFFYVENPVNVQPSRTREDAPQVGVTFSGTRRDVLIQDIVAIHGPRVPSSADAPRVHRQAFLLVVSAGRAPDTARIDKLDRIRREWEVFFLQATEGRMRAITTLR